MLQMWAFSPKGACENLVIDLLGQAQATVDCAMFRFTNKKIIDAFLAAVKRGVNVRLILDGSQMLPLSAQVKAYKQLRKGGVDVRLCLVKGGWMHDKYLVVDRRFVESGSFNYTFQAQAENHENVQIQDDSILANAYLVDFENIWAVSKHRRTRLSEPYWALCSLLAFK